MTMKKWHLYINNIVAMAFVDEYCYGIFPFNGGFVSYVDRLNGSGYYFIGAKLQLDNWYSGTKQECSTLDEAKSRCERYHKLLILR